MVWFSGDVSNSSKIGPDDLGGFSSLNEFVILQTWDSSDRVSVGRDGKEGVEPVPGSWLPQGSFTSLLLQVLPPQEQQQQNFDLDLIHTPSSPNSSAHPPHPPFTQALGQEPGGTWRALEFTDLCSEAALALLMLMNSSGLPLRRAKWIQLPLLMSWRSSEELCDNRVQQLQLLSALWGLSPWALVK